MLLSTTAQPPTITNVQDTTLGIASSDPTTLLELDTTEQSELSTQKYHTITPDMVTTKESFSTQQGSTTHEFPTTRKDSTTPPAFHTTLHGFDTTHEMLSTQHDSTTRSYFHTTPHKLETTHKDSTTPREFDTTHESLSTHQDSSTAPEFHTTPPEFDTTHESLTTHQDGTTQLEFHTTGVLTSTEGPTTVPTSATVEFVIPTAPYVDCPNIPPMPMPSYELLVSSYGDTCTFLDVVGLVPGESTDYTQELLDRNYGQCRFKFAIVHIINLILYFNLILLLLKNI